MLSSGFTKFFHTISISVYTMLILYASKWRYCRHWKTWRNMFVYFSCGWVFRIVFTLINLFYCSFKICVNNKWCFIRFLILIDLQSFSFSRRHNYITKVFIFTYFFMRFNFFFILKEWIQFKWLEIPLLSDVIPLNDTDNFLLQVNAIFLHLESLK